MVKALFFIIILGIVYRLRFKIKGLLIELGNWVNSKKDFWMKLKTPDGVRVLLVVGAFIFFFIFKFFFVVFVLIFLLAWLKPELIFREGVKANVLKNKKKKSKKSKKE